MNSDSHEKEHSELFYEVYMLGIYFGADDFCDVIEALWGVESYGHSEDVCCDSPIVEGNNGVRRAVHEFLEAGWSFPEYFVLEAALS